MTDAAPWPVTLASAAPATRLAVRADTQAAAAIGMTLGVLLGSVPRRAVITRERTALKLGPDEWLILAPESDHALVTQSASTASVVDVSHGLLGITVTGARAAWCINAFNALDLDARAFPVGACTRTVFGKVEIVLWRPGAMEFRIEVARSLGPYVWECLEAASREFLSACPAC